MRKHQLEVNPFGGAIGSAPEAGAFMHAQETTWTTSHTLPKEYSLTFNQILIFYSDASSISTAATVNMKQATNCSIISIGNGFRVQQLQQA